MNAMLSVSARHLSVLSPHEPRYAHAAMTLLSKSCAEFRDVLSRELTAANCDALLGTSILIHYLTWCDLTFLDGQGADDFVSKPLDLSGDLLVLLSPGVRHIFFMAWPYLNVQQSVFGRVAMYKPCNVLEKIVESRGLDWRGVAGRFMAMYDDQRLWGSRKQPERSSSDASSPENGETPLPVPELTAKQMTHLSNRRKLTASAEMDAEILSGLLPTACAGEPSPDSSSLLPSTDKFLVRASYERVVNRLAVILTFLSEISNPPATSLGGSPLTAVSYLMPQRTDIERYFLSFPLLCFGPFLDLILNGDSRALVVLYHIYRAARLLLATQDSWWATKRSAIMERFIGMELKARGLERCLSLNGLTFDGPIVPSVGCPLWELVDAAHTMATKG
jgi:hypothetical protein